MKPVTTDSFLNGRLEIAQTKDGYRFSIDAIIVASSFTPKPNESILDLGTGCGIIPLVLAYRTRNSQITGVEIQPELAQLARNNIIRNHMEQRITVVEADMRKMQSSAAETGYNWVVCNPPYRKPCSGRLNPDAQKARARHEININLKELLATARKSLRPGGRFVTIYPAERLAELCFHMRAHGIEPKWLRCVHSRVDQEAKLILVHGKKGGRSAMTIAPPLSLYNNGGGYTKEVLAMMTP